MHIKKLEICGFKSFVDRTVIHFDHDMIGVVGPNGCGKSNVVDSIRWVMGEQSAKALRGKAMGDVIFNGSETRPQAGFAEVTITFDNGDPQMAQTLPLEYRNLNEISVTRRLYRGDGSNDYFINKVPVRLRDVTEVFLGTGVGRKAYSIVEQGKIGLIVSARPEDRRVLIEEAAGITKYKARKRQAETKMQQTRQNLTRVHDIVSEVERQIDNLQRQAAKANRYLRYRDELDDLVLWEASHRLLELIAVTGVARVTAAELESQAAREREAVERADADLEALRHAAQQAESGAEQAQQEAFEADNVVREKETLITRSSDRYAFLTQRLEAAREEQRELERRAGSLSGETAALRQHLEASESEQSSELERASREEELLRELREAATGAEATLHQLRREEAEASRTIVHAEAKQASFAQRQEDIGRRQHRHELELARLEGEQAGLHVRAQLLGERVDGLSSRRRAMVDARDALRDEIPALEAARDAERAELERFEKDLQRRASRLRALRELESRMEGLGQGVRHLLASGDESLGGLIADRIRVPEAYTEAVAGLAGDRLQCVVVHDVDRALELLQQLGAARKGRASIISPRVGRAPSSLPPAEIADPGVVGLLVDLLDFDPADAGLVRALVGDALVVRSEADARRRRELGPSVDLVTLDGTVFHEDGRISGGNGDSFAAGMLEHRREMAELDASLSRDHGELEARRTRLEELRGRLSRLHDALDEAKAEAHRAELDLVTGQQDGKRLQQQRDLVARRRGEVAGEVEEMVGLARAAQVDFEQLQRTLSKTGSQLENIRKELTAAESIAAVAQQKLGEQQSIATERRVHLAGIQERVTSARQNLVRLEREQTELGQRIATLESERDQAAHETGGVAAVLFGARSALLDARRRARDAQVQLENARLGLTDARHGLGLRENELREQRRGLESKTEALQAQQLECQRLALERQHLEEGIAERYRGLELARVVGDYHARDQVGPDERKRIKELARQIDRMGSVNLDAMKEYEEASERYTYYRDQKEDLEKALSDLEAAIAQMNAESSRLFKHAFEGINRRFKEIFPKMFRGGKAELRLTNPEDMLETGIEILAQPPGKRLANLELMSGGEKAFTAVSLLLSIFRYKPSPFCILDEVDAPLDEANVGRYVEALRAMTDRSQFIIITHSKRTMESVDVLYGVTMQQAGISKLVGVRVSGSPTSN